ncbi:hypothetical protein ROZALSC1DRAFT_26879 [Rozella allomycis CSF55]|uniref:Nuclear condensin complex subunit 3 C-terminal domain-containing protein n=1 Tax=Rozella allomycis (strain CSF55) TaxID=988480 RepID=A0A4P9YPM7_ROZAC|nr:hypothetical protein ROZALSC1DRAFT_26879 [Rozella allomycis CSF55]
MVQGEETVHSQIAALFHQAQEGQITHRKTSSLLKKILQSSDETSHEKEFTASFFHMTSILLSVKKQDIYVQKMFKFICSFFAYACESEKEPGGSRMYRFLENMMIFLLRGTEAKDKSVRYRVCFLLANCMQHLNEIRSDVLWNAIKERMVPRLYDKEANVRVQAVNGMARMQTYVEEAGHAPIMERYIEMMRHDPSADVRKAAMMNMDINEYTIPYILERCADVDVGIRKILFKKRMSDIDWRWLTVEQRQLLLLHGLTDRDEMVKQGCLKMVFDGWMKHSENNLVILLSSLDVVSNVKVAEELLKGYFATITKLPEHNFDEKYWENLTPETIVYWRFFCEHINDHTELDVGDYIPSLSKYTEYLKVYQGHFRKSPEESQLAYEFIINQMLSVLKMLDFSDEVGRRVFYEEIKTLLMDEKSAETTLPLLVDCLERLCEDEKEFTRVMIDILTDIGELIERNDLPNQMEAMTLEEYSAEDLEQQSLLATIKCLYLIKVMLQKAKLSHVENVSLEGIIQEMILPSIESEIAIIQERGLECLGLICTLDKQSSIEYMPIFLSFVNLIEDSSKIKAIQIVFDLIILFGLNSFPDCVSPFNNETLNLLNVLKKCLYSKDPQVQTLTVQGFSKLFLFNILNEPEILGEQSLNYFINLFSFSSIENQSLVTSHPSIHPGEKDSMLNIQQIAHQLIDWTDSTKCLKNPSSIQLFHPDLALELATEALNEPAAYAKHFVQIISKLKLNHSIKLETLESLHSTLSSLQRLISSIDSIQIHSTQNDLDNSNIESEISELLNQDPNDIKQQLEENQKIELDEISDISDLLNDD